MYIIQHHITWKLFR